jgi:hypothetical protein
MRCLVLLASLACGGTSSKTFADDDLSCGLAGGGGVAAQLERQLVAIFSDDYPARLAEARQRIVSHQVSSQ